VYIKIQTSQSSTNNLALIFIFICKLYMVGSLVKYIYILYNNYKLITINNIIYDKWTVKELHDDFFKKNKYTITQTCTSTTLQLLQGHEKSRLRYRSTRTCIFPHKGRHGDPVRWKRLRVRRIKGAGANPNACGRRAEQRAFSVAALYKPPPRQVTGREVYQIPTTPHGPLETPSPVSG
jgi:hypothetical protein